MTLLKHISFLKSNGPDVPLVAVLDLSVWLEKETNAMLQMVLKGNDGTAWRCVVACVTAVFSLQVAALQKSCSGLVQYFLFQAVDSYLST